MKQLTFSDRTLEREMARLQPLPKEAIYLGTATDHYPVLYSLADNEMKHLLIKCSSRFPFETIIRSRSSYQTERFPVEFLMISNADMSCRVAYEKITALQAWIKAGAIGKKEGMVVFVEDLGNLLSSEEHVVESFKQLLIKSMKHNLRVITCSARRIPIEVEQFFSVIRETDYGSCLYRLNDGCQFWTPV